MKEERNRQARYFNARRREVVFEPGEKVWRRNFALSSGPKNIAAKLTTEYVGPLTVLAKTGSNTYTLEDEEGYVEENVHVQHMKKHQEDETSSDESAKPECHQEDSTAEEPTSEDETETSEYKLTGNGPVIESRVCNAQKKTRGCPRKNAIATNPNRDKTVAETTDIGERGKRPRGRSRE